MKTSAVHKYTAMHMMLFAPTMGSVLSVSVALVVHFQVGWLVTAMIVIGLFRGLLVLHVGVARVVGNTAKCADMFK